MLRIGLVSVAVLVAIWVLNDDRGLPLAALILLGFVLVFSYITTKTTFGTSSRWAGTPRRLAAPASTSRGCGSWCS